jgi:hypothetical protein
MPRQPEAVRDHRLPGVEQGKQAEDDEVDCQHDRQHGGREYRHEPAAALAGFGLAGPEVHAFS